MCIITISWNPSWLESLRVQQADSQACPIAPTRSCTRRDSDLHCPSFEHYMVVRESRGEHTSHTCRVFDALSGHPLRRALLKVTTALVVLQRADSTPSDGEVELHVGLLETISSGVQMSDRRRRVAFDVSDSGPKEQRNRVGPWHPLPGDTTSSCAGGGKESRVAVLRRDRQCTACAKIEPFDTYDLDSRHQRATDHGLVFIEQLPGCFRATAIELGLYPGQHGAVVLPVKPILGPSLDALDRLALALIRLVGGEPYIVAARAQFGGDVQLPAAARFPKERGTPPRHFTEFAEVHQVP